MCVVGPQASPVTTAPLLICLWLNVSCSARQAAAAAAVSEGSIAIGARMTCDIKDGLKKPLIQKPSPVNTRLPDRNLIKKWASSEFP